MPSKKKGVRIDFVIEIVETNDKTRIFKAILRPNPERYDIKIKNGKQYLYDKFDKIYLPHNETIANFAKQAKGLPIYASIPKIDDFKRYMAERLSKINEYFDGKKIDYKSVDKSETFLKKLEDDHEHRFVILCIDLIGSTKMSQTLSELENAKIIAIFLQEMAAVVSNYNGYILKYVGDGLIAYFPEPNFLGMNDSAVDCALGMKMVIEKALNPSLAKRKLPQLKFRIGIDSGHAVVKQIGESSTKKQKDLTGLTINFATKIQSVASTNRIVLGETTLTNLYYSRRQMFRKFHTKKWKYRIPKRGPIYKLYSLKK